MKCGAAWSRANYSGLVTEPPDVFIYPESNTTRSGWIIGAGFEAGLWNNWSWKVEYNYMDFGTNRYSFTETTGTFTRLFDIDTQVHTVKVGLNYRFGELGKGPVGKGPVVARY